MALDRDPYAVLGLPRSATLEEVKRAYRRLAKANHPDAAGEAALPRFLAIQAAYTKIVEPPATGAVRAATWPPSRPWEADPSRANATHRAYGGRGRRTRPSPGPRPAGDPGASSAEAPPRAGGPGSGGGPRPGTGDAAGAGAATGAGAGPSSTGAGPRAGGDTTSGPRSTSAAPNKATLGSTSYDGADAEPFEPDWGGASWYGTSSGTYWMLNPKEYADPRKHGPEYQARARRKLRSRQAETGGSGGAPPRTAGWGGGGGAPGDDRTGES